MNLTAPTKLESYQVATDLQGLQELKSKARDDQASALRPVAEQFEAMFIQQILKQSREVKLDEGWLDGDKADFYRGLGDEQLAQSLSAKGGLGLADKLVEDLTPRQRVMKPEAYHAYRAEQAASGSSALKTSQADSAYSTQANLALRGL